MALHVAHRADDLNSTSFVLLQELTPEEVTTASHLEIPLMTAERAWAYAMQRKQETAGAPYRVRRHVVTRLAKAAKVSHGGKQMWFE